MIFEHVPPNTYLVIRELIPNFYLLVNGHDIIYRRPEWSKYMFNFIIFLFVQIINLSNSFTYW